MTPALLGVVFGSALQLRQPALWGWPAYAFMVLAAVALLAACSFSFLRRNRAAVGAAVVFVACGVLAYGLTGLRASHFATQGLDPALEGRDITVTGMVAAM